MPPHPFTFQGPQSRPQNVAGVTIATGTHALLHRGVQLRRQRDIHRLHGHDATHGHARIHDCQFLRPMGFSFLAREPGEASVRREATAYHLPRRDLFLPAEEEEHSGEYNQFVCARGSAHGAVRQLNKSASRSPDTPFCNALRHHLPHRGALSIGCLTIRPDRAGLAVRFVHLAD